MNLISPPSPNTQPVTLSVLSIWGAVTVYLDFMMGHDKINTVSLPYSIGLVV